MLFPRLQETDRYREMTTVFGGYNHQISCQEAQFYHEFVITRQSGTEDSISVYDTEQTCAVIDEKLSSFKPSDDVDLSDYYTSEVVDAALNEKVFIPSSKTYNVLSSNSIDLTKQIDYILDETENLYFTCDILNPVNGFANEVYVYFISGETPTTIESDENTSIKWIGDDCNSDGTFTPQANMSYEVSFKILSSFSGIGPMFSILARVGAC